MSKVYPLLEKKGLVTVEQVETSFRKWTPQQATSLRDELLDALEEDKASIGCAPSDVTGGEFRFFASSSIRGDYGCQVRECRATKAANLARYAALYCDNVIVPIRLDQHTIPETDNFHFNEDLAGSILCLQEFRPATEAGILQLVPDSLHFCPDCARDATARFTKTEKLAETFLLRNKDKFSVEFVPADPETPLPRVEINGPEEYLEHGRIIRIFWEEPDWIRSLGAGGAPKSRYRLSPTEVEKSEVVSSMLSKLAWDAAFQQAYPASPAFATLTKTAGVCTNNSQLGTPQAAPTVRPPEMRPTYPQLTAHYPLFTILLTPLSATLIDHLVCVANTALTETLNPLNATLTKKRGRGNHENSIFPDRLTWYCAGCVACCRSFRDVADC